MQKGNEFYNPVEAFDLHEKGLIILKRTFLTDDLGQRYRVIRFGDHLGVFCIFVEYPNGDHMPLNEWKIKKMKLKIAPDKGLSLTDWIDPP